MPRNLSIIFILTFFLNLLVGNEIIIQEYETGFCSVDGSIQTSVRGYTGDGYADTDRGIGKSVSWSVYITKAGTYYLKWRYGNGGGSGDRPAKLLINLQIAIDTVNFAHTGTWDNWTISDSVSVTLTEGYNNIRLEAYSQDGLANIDYISISGEDVQPIDCVNIYTLKVSQNIEEGGIVSYEPVRDYYEEGTMITLTAIPNPGYFFQSWSGDVTSVDSVFSFEIDKNVIVEAVFLPIGTKPDPELVGYATVQDDNGTPYYTIGGMLGDSVFVNSIDQLEYYLSHPDPYIVSFSEHFIGEGEISVSSNKTIIGIGDNAHLEGIGLSINRARNVIIKNIKVSHVHPKDAVEINGASKNIWIHKCKFFSDREHDKDYYDGLLDIKNQSSFITVSWCKFHDHYKTILISSGDQQVADTLIRVTFHHNYFYNCESRLPSIRFGKAHIFNNYYKNCGTAINSRMGACVRIERNYFFNVGTAVMMAYSPKKGTVELIDNYFGNSNYSSTPSCHLEVPYEYEHILDNTEDIPALIAGDVAIDDNNTTMLKQLELNAYPNPFNKNLKIEYTVPEQIFVKIEIYDILGRKIMDIVNGKRNAGKYTHIWNGKNYYGKEIESGIYFIILNTNKNKIYRKVLFIK